jgi:hypothetical protein
MATELSREAYVIPATGQPAFIIEQGRAESGLDDFSRFKVVVGGSTIREGIPNRDAAVALIEALGGSLMEAGDERSLAAEIGGNSVFQAAMAPRITALAAELAEHKAADEGQGERVMAAAVATGQAVPDSQATGVMEVTTGLGGVRSHGLGERFEGAAEPHLEAAALKVQAEDELLAANAAAGAVSTPVDESLCNVPVGNGTCILPAGHDGSHRLHEVVESDSGSTGSNE